MGELDVMQGLKDSGRTDDMELAFICVFGILDDNLMDMTVCTHL
jgi:hypothetical protein